MNLRVTVRLFHERLQGTHIFNMFQQVYNCLYDCISWVPDLAPSCTYPRRMKFLAMDEKHALEPHLTGFGLEYTRTDQIGGPLVASITIQSCFPKYRA